MPRGTCQICGCTEDHACPNGCAWTEASRTLCSQCCGWTIIEHPHPYEGIFEHELVPVRTFEPVPIPHPFTGRPCLVHFVDARRIDAETLARVACVAAPLNGGTVEEFLADAAGNPWFMPVQATRTVATFYTPTREAAVAAAAELALTGTVARARKVEILADVLNVFQDLVNEEGGGHRG